MILSYPNEVNGGWVIHTVYFTPGQGLVHGDGNSISADELIDRGYRINCISRDELKRLKRLCVKHGGGIAKDDCDEIHIVRE